MLFFFQMCCHLLWKQWKSLLGFCLRVLPLSPWWERPLPWLVVLSSPKCVRQHCQWNRKCRRTFGGISDSAGVQSHETTFLLAALGWLGGDHHPLLELGGWWKTFDKRKVLLQGLAGNLPLEDCESSLLTKWLPARGSSAKLGAAGGQCVQKSQEPECVRKARRWLTRTTSKPSSLKTLLIIA